MNEHPKSLVLAASKQEIADIYTRKLLEETDKMIKSAEETKEIVGDKGVESTIEKESIQPLTAQVAGKRFASWDPNPCVEPCGSAEPCTTGKPCFILKDTSKIKIDGFVTSTPHGWFLCCTIECQMLSSTDR